MRNLAFLSLWLGLGALALAPPAAATAAVDYLEVGDAGDEHHAQVMFGDGSVRFIHGTIGGSDLIDVFTFRLANPPDPIEPPVGIAPTVIAILPQTVAAHVAIVRDDETPPDPIRLFLHLLDEHGNLLAFGDGSVRKEGLLPGIYHVGVSTFDPDPAYIVTFDLGNTQLVPFAVPEPTSLALFGLGLAGLALRRRRG